MLFAKRNTVKAIVARHYKSMLRTAKTSPISQNPEFELLPAMFVVIDYAALSAQKDRRLFAIETTRAMKSVYRSLDTALLDKRTQLYGEIIRGRTVRGEWFLGGDASVLCDNPVSSCTVLLGDILFNPECADNYDTAPMTIHSIFDTERFFNSVMLPLQYEMFELFEEIHRL